MAKPPSFNFYSSDFLTGVMLMNYEQRGKYITLLCLQHQQGHISEEDMLEICGSYDKKIFSKFKQDEQGNYYNERLDEETIKRQKFVESRLSNLSKENKDNSHMDNRMDNHTESRMENEIEIENTNVNKSINNIKNNDIYYIDLFNTLWQRYPKKENKKTAIHNFLIIKPDNELFEKMKNAIERSRRWKGWSNPRFIPHFATWLSREQWNDEIPEDELSSFDINDWANEKGINW